MLTSILPTFKRLNFISKQQQKQQITLNGLFAPFKKKFNAIHPHRRDEITKIIKMILDVVLKQNLCVRVIGNIKAVSSMHPTDVL